MTNNKIYEISSEHVWQGTKNWQYNFQQFRKILFNLYINL